MRMFGGCDLPDLRIHRRKAEIPTYSFEKHQRQKETTTIYSCHVLILEGIFALYDPRVLELLDMKVLLPKYGVTRCTHISDFKLM